MKKAKSWFGACLRDESGQDLVEYALIMVVVSLGAVAGLHSLANVLSNVPNALMQKFWNAYAG